MKLSLEKIDYKYKALEPVMSEATLKYHRDKLAASYVRRFNEKEGDGSFNEAGAFLHNIFFPQFKSPAGSNKPFGSSLSLIEDAFDSFEGFKEEFQKIAMSVQGSGWIYLSSKGEIKIIKNHQIKKDIALLVDWWEHAWALDYQSDKRKYLENIWRIVDWSKVNDRLNVTVRSARSKQIGDILKTASRKKSPFGKPFRRWLRESYYKNRIDQGLVFESKIRLSNWLFSKEDGDTKLALLKLWESMDKKEDPPHIEEEPSPFKDNALKPEPLQLDLFSEAGTRNQFAKEGARVRNLVKYYKDYSS